MVHSSLISDILIILINKEFNEQNIELIHKIISLSGFKLRNDDPNQVRETFSEIQKKTDLILTKNKRLEFLLEMIKDIKNNKKSLSQKENIERFNNILKTINKIKEEFNIKTENQIRITYDDIVNSKLRGRWWITGASWKGRDNVVDTVYKKTLENVKTKEIKILEKKALEMNFKTDLKKTVFFIIMSSEDYLDAFQQLLKIDINKNDLNVSQVLVQCCLKEKNYNPFYSLLMNHICNINNRITQTLKKLILTTMSTIEKLKMSEIINFSKLFSNFISNEIFTLSVFKNYDFRTIQNNEIIFFRLFFISLFISNDGNKLSNLIFKVTKNKNLTDFKESLVIFLFQFVNDNSRRSFLFDYLPIFENFENNFVVNKQKIDLEIKEKSKLCKKLLSSFEIDTNEDYDFN
jgi:nucleolar MIF4G domain-containing protein 1